VTLTVALGTPAPELSVTLPKITLVPVCPNTTFGTSRNVNRTIRISLNMKKTPCDYFS